MTPVTPPVEPMSEEDDGWDFDLFRKNLELGAWDMFMWPAEQAVGVCKRLLNHVDARDQTIADLTDRAERWREKYDTAQSRYRHMAQEWTAAAERADAAEQRALSAERERDEAVAVMTEIRRWLPERGAGHSTPARRAIDAALATYDQEAK